MSPAAPAAGADAPDWIVLKFGGTSVSRRHRWNTIGKLAKQRADEQGVRVLVEKKSLLYLLGTTLEFSGGLNGKGFAFSNPNATRTCGCGESFAV